MAGDSTGDKKRGLPFSPKEGPSKKRAKHFFSEQGGPSGQAAGDTPSGTPRLRRNELGVFSRDVPQQTIEVSEGDQEGTLSPDIIRSRYKDAFVKRAIVGELKAFTKAMDIINSVNSGDQEDRERGENSLRKYQRSDDQSVIGKIEHILENAEREKTNAEVNFLSNIPREDITNLRSNLDKELKSVTEDGSPAVNHETLREKMEEASDLCIKIMRDYHEPSPTELRSMKYCSSRGGEIGSMTGHTLYMEFISKLRFINSDGAAEEELTGNILGINEIHKSAGLQKFTD